MIQPRELPSSHWMAVPTEQRVLTGGVRASAHVDVYERNDRGTRGPSYYADLSWKGQDGQQRTFQALAIGEDAYNIIKRASADQNFEIRYLDGERPFLLIDSTHRENEMGFVKLMFPLFAILFAASAIWFLRNLLAWTAREKATGDADLRGQSPD